MTDKAPEADFLHKLFAALNASSIRYAVMRNHEPLPYSTGGSDLDIFVDPSDAQAAKELLLSVVHSVDGEIIGVVQTWNFFEAYIIGSGQGNWWGVCVEFYSGIVFKSSVPLVDQTILTRYFEVYNDITIIPTNVGNTIGYIKEILVHNEFRRDKPQYQESAALLIMQRPNLFGEIFSPLGVHARDLLMSVLDSISTSEAVPKIKKFRFFVKLRAFVSDPFLFVFRRLGHEIFRWRRFVRPPGTGPTDINFEYIRRLQPIYRNIR